MTSLSNKAILSVTLACITLLSLLFAHANSTEFLVGVSGKWNVPPSNDTDFYNHWAQKQRFKVNDTLEFRYKKDSVMQVSEPEYEKCNSTEPITSGKQGDTHIVLNRSGPFYFISGLMDHCEGGQKMIVKVMDIQTPPINNPNDAPNDHNNNKKNGAKIFEFRVFSTLGLVVLGFVSI